MSNEELIGVDPLDWMNKSEIEDVKNEVASENKTDEITTYDFKLDKNFDIRVLDDLYKDIMQKFNQIKNINVDVSNVSKIDAASIQFLSSLKKTADDKLINIRFQNPNDYFTKSVSLMGLTEVFN